MRDSSTTLPRRVCVYIDGFNLYHAIAELNDHRLKWLNMRSLAASYVKPHEQLEKVYFFTAVLTWKADKQARHKNYMAAQRAVGVEVVESNFRRVRKFCFPHTRWCKNYEEKQTDVAIAAAILADAANDRFQRAVLMTADSDQIPLVKTLREVYPDKRITLSAPPGRADRARELGAVVHDRTPLTIGRLHAHRLPRDVLDENGSKVATMPAFYAD